MAKKTNKLVTYFKEVKSELKKVSWPNFKQIKNNTLIVIACILIIGSFIWIFDAIFDISLGAVVDKMQGETVTDNAESQMSPEEELEFLKAYLADYGINYDGQKFTDANGKELTEEEVNKLIADSAADAETKPEENSNNQ